MHLDVWNWLCAGRIGFGWAHDTFYIACHMFMHSHAYVLSFQYTCYIWIVLGLFWLSLSLSPSLSFSLSLFLPLSSVCISLCLWHLNANLFHPKTLFILGHPFHLILLLHLFGSVMKMPKRPSWRIFLDEAFILNAKLSWRTSPTLTYPMSFTVGVGSHYVTSRSHVHPCWSRSFTPTCMDLIFQYLILSLVFEVRVLLSHRKLLQMCSMSLR